MRFRWIWTGLRTLNTFNLNFFDHIFDSCATSAAIRRRTTLARARFCQPCTACWVFLFSLVYLASLVCFVFCLFVWHSYLIGFSSQFLVRIKIGANMAAGWRLRLGACVCVRLRWQHWPLDIFGLFLSVLFGSTVAVELLLAFCYDFCYFENKIKIGFSFLFLFCELIKFENSRFCLNDTSGTEPSLLRVLRKLINIKEWILFWTSSFEMPV